MNCIKCGATLRKDATFCLNCGQKVAKPISVGGMIGIAIVAGIISGLLSQLFFREREILFQSIHLFFYSFYFMFICCFLSLKYALLSTTIMSVVVGLTNSVQNRIELERLSREMGWTIDGKDFNWTDAINIVSLLSMLLIALIVNLLVKKNRSFMYILSIFIFNIQQFVRWGLDGTLEYILREEPIWALLIYYMLPGILGCSCAACICFWIRKRFPQFMQKLR